MDGRTEASGGCLCGAVRFRAGLPSRWVAHCHCAMCRRAHGAAFVTWVSVPAARFRLQEGAEAALAWHASSAEAERGFCRHCGASMLFRSRLWAEEMHVAAACLDDGPDRMPQMHAFWDAHVGWTRADPDLPTRTEAEIRAALAKRQG
ncbi:GFA family protein [Roseomonas sp. AR75]|uniref:GFA family protein n=1 Tax=Roseomonas sp. AR75 TaxID=2562311 RepID=UPI0010BFEDD0|nr:GFA family protein [Roseomonas sp. AR75]